VFLHGGFNGVESDGTNNKYRHGWKGWGQTMGQRRASGKRRFPAVPGPFTG
jgi:hypothetical protein